MYMIYTHVCMYIRFMCMNVVCVCGYIVWMNVVYVYVCVCMYVCMYICDEYANSSSPEKRGEGVKRGLNCHIYVCI